MSSVDYTPYVGNGFNASGQTVSKRRRHKERSLNIPPDERRLLRQPGETNRNCALEKAHQDIFDRYKQVYGFRSVLDAISKLTSRECPKEMMAEFIKFRDQHMNE